jgi:hypothetical protein
MRLGQREIGERPTRMLGPEMAIPFLLTELKPRIGVCTKSFSSSRIKTACYKEHKAGIKKTNSSFATIYP